MRRFVTVALAVMFLSITPVGGVPRARATTAPLPSNATLVVPGHGWGHGRGLGQWGAKGMAQDGSTSTQILAHYYSGVTFGSRTAKEDLRVLVESSPDVVVTSDSPFKVSWSNGTLVAQSDATYKYLRARYDGSNYIVERSTAYNSGWTQVARASTYAVFTRGSSLLQLIFNNGVVRYYRGKIIARYSSADGVRAINQLTMQEYLYASVPRESPASWPAETLKAQAVSARTYAAYKKDAARAKGTMFDICATTSCQVYLGYASKPSPSGSRTLLENSNSNDAVDATAGTVLLYNGKPILAEYSSSTGGYSAPGSVSYQKAVKDLGDEVSPHHDWTATIKVSEIEKRWPSIGHLVDVQETSRNGFGDWGGRVSEMQLVGTDGTETISGAAFRTAFAWPSRSHGVKSTWFDVRYWRGELQRAPGAISILAGQTQTVVAQIKNSGNTSWAVGGPVRIATATDSPFAGPVWISPTRAASVASNVTDPSKQTVAPGEVAEFRIPLSTDGVAPGVYSQRFSAVADGASVMAVAFTASIQVLPTWTEEAPNLLTNGSFDTGISGWARSGLVSGDGPQSETVRDGARALLLAGGGTKRVSQTVSFGGGTSRRFALGGWSRAAGSNPDGGALELLATATYADGTAGSTHLDFGKAAHPWTYAETAFTTSATKQLASITLAARSLNQTGTAFFDALRLLESPISNPSFEQGMTGWGATGFGDGDGVTTSAARDGARALVLAGAGSQNASQVIPFAGARGERFTLSAWHRSVGTDPSGGAIAVAITLRNADGTTTSQTLDIATDAHDWTLGEIVVTAAKDFTGATVVFARASQTGQSFFDAVRIARTLTAGASFEGGLAGWTTYGFEGGDGATGLAREGAGGLKLTGSGRQGVVQQIATSGAKGARAVVSGWTRASGTDPKGGTIGFLAAFRNSDGTTSWLRVPASRTAHGWTFREAAFVAPKAFTRIDLYAVLYDQTGSAFFDGVRLRRA